MGKRCSRSGEQLGLSEKGKHVAQLSHSSLSVHQKREHAFAQTRVQDAESPWSQQTLETAQASLSWGIPTLLRARAQEGAV